MRWTLCYTLMTASLGSALAYGYNNFKNDSLGLQNRMLDQAFSLNQPKEPAVHVHKKVEAPEVPKIDDSPKVEIGATRDDVLATLGTPSVIDEENDRWTYGLHVITFKNDRVSGCVRLDQERAEDLFQLKAAGKGKNKAYGQKSAANFRDPYKSALKKYSASSTYAMSASRGTGSARGATNYGYRSGTGSNQGYSNSYYMSRSGPRYQPFFRNAVKPRGMSGGFGGVGGTGSSFGRSFSSAWGSSNSMNRGYSSNSRSAR